MVVKRALSLMAKLPSKLNASLWSLARMLFSSLFFLFFFLPIALAGHFILKQTQARNVFLLAASILFYAWGELSYLWLVLAMIVINYIFAIAVEEAKSRGSNGKSLLVGAVVTNIGLLFWYKYANFLTENLNWLLHTICHSSYVIPAPEVVLPLGISFLTFHCLSYVIDVFRGVAKAQRNFVSLSLYISLFPQLIAGPVIRYHEIYRQLTERVMSSDHFAEGIRRFVVGLGKKMLLANTMAGTVDAIFALSIDEISCAAAWLAAISYTLQIYFDFSGYSDMAIGLGQMFGFRFPENFDYPYIASSIQQFWRRWHMSLSNWFRDYLYIPLGGNRFGDARTCINLITIFFLCGLWHGASWTFVVWGLYHGAFLGAERLGLDTALNRLWKPIRHAYALLVIVVGWVIFRSESLGQSGALLMAMFFPHNTETAIPVSQLVDLRTMLVMLVGVLASTPLLRLLPATPSPMVPLFRLAATSIVLLFCIGEMAAGSYNPFIYFRF